MLSLLWLRVLRILRYGLWLLWHECLTNFCTYSLINSHYFYTQLFNLPFIQLICYILQLKISLTYPLWSKFPLLFSILISVSHFYFFYRQTPTLISHSLWNLNFYFNLSHFILSLTSLLSPQDMFYSLLPRHVLFSSPGKCFIFFYL